MNQLRRSIFSFFILCLTIQAADCQDSIGFYLNIAEKLRNYCEALPREEIYTHTDRSEYIAGEILWFNVYLVDRQTNKPSQKSRIVYAELLNSQNWPVVRKQLRIEEGLGPGQMTLPDTLSTGRYTFRAYTSWMKNFMPTNCFTRELNIYNISGQQTVKLTSEKAGGTKNVSENVHDPGNSDPGSVLRVNNMQQDSLLIFINGNDLFRFDNKYYCYLVVQTHGIINLIKTISLASSWNRLALNKKVLMPGINQIVIFNPGGQPVAERYIYTPSEETDFLTVNSPDSIYPRGKITIEIKPVKTRDTSFSIRSLSLSSAVVSNNRSFPDLADYTVFGTEFGILPDEIRFHKLKSLSPEVIDNFLLTVKSNWIDWNKVIRGNIPYLRYKTETDYHVLSGTLLKKNSDEVEANKCLFLSIPDKTPDFRYALTDSSGRFIFYIPIDEKIRNLIIQPEDTGRDYLLRIESPFAEEYPPELKPADSSGEPHPENISEMCINYQVRKIYKLSDDIESLQPGMPVPKSKRFYGKPDIELKMSDYILLPTMQEVFFELTPGIFLRGKNGAYTMSIFDPVGKTVYRKPPILFIDGVVVNNPSIIAGLDPGLVEKIDAVTDLYVVGDYCFFGIVNIITRAGDFSCVSLPPGAMRLNYRSVDQVRSFLLTDYPTDELRQSRIPDFRNTLYWNPAVKPDPDGIIRIDFRAPDNTGNYEFNFKGISGDGTMIDIRKIINCTH